MVFMGEKHQNNHEYQSLYTQFSTGTSIAWKKK